MIEILGRQNGPTELANPQKEERDSAIPSSHRQAMMHGAYSPNGEEVVIDTRQIVLGTSQESQEEVGCQLIRL